MSPKPPATDLKFHYPLKIAWEDCDSAKIVYTGRVPCLALKAIEAWWEAYNQGESWYQLTFDQGIGTPFVRIETDLLRPITPRHELVCTVWPSRLGNTSLEFSVEGHQEQSLCFGGRFVCVFSDARTFKKIPCPDKFRGWIAPLLLPPYAGRDRS